MLLYAKIIYEGHSSLYKKAELEGQITKYNYIFISLNIKKISLWAVI